MLRLLVQQVNYPRTWICCSTTSQERQPTSTAVTMTSTSRKHKLHLQLARRKIYHNVHQGWTVEQNLQAHGPVFYAHPTGTPEADAEAEEQMDYDAHIFEIMELMEETTLDTTLTPYSVKGECGSMSYIEDLKNKTMRGCMDRL